MADAIAVYGAVIGTAGALGAVWNIYHAWWRDAPRIKFELVKSYSKHPSVTNPNEVLSMIVTRNRGRRPVTVARLPALLFSSGHLVFAATFEDLPKRLDEGTKITAWIYESDLKKELVGARSLPTHIVLRDDSGKRHRRRLSKWELSYLRSLLGSPGLDTWVKAEEHYARDEIP